MKDHIIVCGISYNLADFISPLRGFQVQNPPAVVVLSNVIPTRRQFEQIAIYDDVHYYEGSALIANDLHAVNLLEASAVVVLATENVHSLEVNDFSADRCRKLASFVFPVFLFLTLVSSFSWKFLSAVLPLCLHILPQVETYQVHRNLRMKIWWT